MSVINKLLLFSAACFIEPFFFYKVYSVQIYFCIPLFIISYLNDWLEKIITGPLIFYKSFLFMIGFIFLNFVKFTPFILLFYTSIFLYSDILSFFPIFKNIYVSFLVTVNLFYITNSDLGYAIQLSYFFRYLAFEIIDDVYDIEKDKLMKRETIPIKFGILKSIYLSKFCFFIASVILLKYELYIPLKMLLVENILFFLFDQSLSYLRAIPLLLYIIKQLYI